MADPYEAYSFDGNDFSVTADYGFIFAYADPFGVSGTVEMQARRSIEPQVMSVSRDGRTIPIQIFNRDPANLTAATFRSNIKKWFTPGKNTAARYLVFYADDGSTLVRVPVYVQALDPIYETDQNYMAVLTMAQPWFEANSATVSAANPATVTNAGNVATRPSVAITQSTHKTLRACTVAAAVGFGFTQYPIRFLLSSTSATNTNTFTYVNGVSVPNYVTDSGGAGSAVWCLIDCAPDGSSTYVDIIYGTSITNPLCHTLDPGDMMDNSGSSNATWSNNNWDVTTNPNCAGVWVAAVTGKHVGGAVTGYQITSDGGSVVISLLPGEASDYDSVAIRIPVGLASGGLDNVSRTTANTGTGGGRGYIRYRVAGSDRWVDLWTTVANGTVTTDVTGAASAVTIAIGFEDRGIIDDPCTFTITDDTGDTDITINTSNDPTVTVGSAANVDYYNGTLVVGGYTLTFTNCFAPDGTLTIDAATKSISSSGSGAIYNAPTFSDPAIWMALEPGSNTITDGLTATAADTWTHRDGYE